MLKFTRNSRSSSAERNNSSRIPRVQALQKTNTRDFSPARYKPDSPISQELPAEMTTPRSSRSTSAERTVMKSRRQLNFDRENPSPRMISAQRSLAAAKRPQSPPPPVPEFSGNTEEDQPKPKLPPRLPQRRFPINLAESDYNQVSSGTYCRLRKKPNLAPMTPTLEKLSHPHIVEGVRPLLMPAKSVLKNSNKYDFHRAVERLVEKLDLHLLDTSSESGYGSDDHDSLNSRSSSITSRASSINSTDVGSLAPPPLPRRLRPPPGKRVHFDSYVLLLQGIRERNLELVQRNVTEVCKEALATEEVMLEFVKAVIAGEDLIVHELLTHGLNPNFGDPAGLTPLHFAAAFNSLSLIKLLVNAGSAIYPRAHSSGKIPSEMCSLNRPNFQACHAYLRCIEECLGVANNGRAFVVRPYRTCRSDELCVQPGDCLRVLRKGDYDGSSWWWCLSLDRNEEGYVLKDLLSLNRPSEILT